MSIAAPDALSVTNPAAVNAIHSPDSKCIKGSFYSIAEPQRNLLMIRQKAEHAKKRRTWDRCFNVKCEFSKHQLPVCSHLQFSVALNDYEPTVWAYTEALISQISTHRGKPMNIARWLQFFAFDVMTGM